MLRPVKVYPVSAFLQTLATVALVVFVLHAAKSVIIPVALAVLGAFVLTPIVTLWETRVGLKRVPAALLTLVLAGLVLAGIGWMIASQVSSLARELPEHTENIKAKIGTLRGAGGPVSAVTDLIREVSQSGEKTIGPDGKPEPIKTIPTVRVEDTSGLTRLAESGGAVAEPLASAALVAVLTAFMLIGREDLRDRLLGVLGEGQLLGTTRVLGESAHKVSRFLLFQLAVNAGFGVLLTVGLQLLGVSYAPLWGLLCGLLRFIPFVGTWAGFLFPFALSFATAPDWTQPIEVFVYFLVLDLVTANVVEPLVFGQHTGVSPLALLIAVAFWTWVWGPLGLLLSTPITVCLAVIGQHVPRLRPLALLLGDQPPLEAAVQYYQRLLAKDRAGAAKVAADLAAADGLTAAYDGVVIPALAMACRDRAAGDLTAEEEEGVFEGTAAVLDATDAGGAAVGAIAGPPAAAPAVVIGAPAQRSAEGLPLRMLANALGADPCRVVEASTQLLPVQIEQMVADLGATVVVVSIIPPGGLPQAGYLCRRLRKRFPDLPIVVAYWGPPGHYDKLLVRLRKVGVSYVTTSLVQTCNQVRALLPKAV